LTKPQRTRRSGDEVRHALLTTAASAFARGGYAGTGMRDVARAAGTSETAIYLHFGSKAELFRQAVLDPFIGVLEDYTEAFRETISERPLDPEKFMLQWVEQLYDHLHAGRASVLALISASGEPDAQPAFQQAVAGLNQMFTDIFGLTTQAWESVGQGFDLDLAPVWLRLMAGMIISITALEPLLLSKNLEHTSREKLIKTSSDFMLYGVFGNKGDALTGLAERAAAAERRETT
jgi:AcrR family transcriptional regulator